MYKALDRPLKSLEKTFEGILKDFKKSLHCLYEPFWAPWKAFKKPLITQLVNMPFRSLLEEKKEANSARSAGKKLLCCTHFFEASLRKELLYELLRQASTGENKKRLRAKRGKKMCFLLPPSLCCQKNVQFQALAGLSKLRDLKQINKTKNRRPGNPFYRHEGGGDVF